jgi:beta-mannosidase
MPTCGYFVGNRDGIMIGLKSNTMNRRNILSAVIFLWAALPAPAIEGETSQIIPLDWYVGHHNRKEAGPAEWYPAIVPGAVQLDYARAHGWGDHNYAENWKDYRWMEDVFWTYRTSFSRPGLEPDERIYFVSKGIDYKFEIILNEKKLLAQEGMFKAVDLDLTDLLMENNTLEVRIFPVPKVPGRNDDASQAAQSVKPAVSYGWDWHPRLIPSGIWDETYLEVRNQSHFLDVFVDYRLTEDFQHADVNLQVEGNQADDKNYEWTLTDPEGKPIVNESGMIADLASRIFPVESPQLWWTHDHGRPALYSSRLALLDADGHILDIDQQKIGFRRIRLVMHEGAWSKPDTFPKGRSNPPITIELNGRRIFAKGSNWVNPDIFPGTITRERYDGLIQNGLKLNFNIFRVWGGGIVNKEAFYELCDGKGILVWTEFPLACNNYVGTPAYLSVLKQESGAIIQRIRKHPSNLLWSGGNELFNGWSRMTEQSLALRLLNSQCYHLDPKTPFIYTSPLMGMAHGHYVFKDQSTGEEVFQWMPRAGATAYSEFGMPGASPVELLRKIIPEDELFPPLPGTSWESHHAFHAWGPDRWLMPGVLEEYFGRADNLEELVANSQLLQCEGYKCIFEEARRQKPVCAMAINWCYNEPWITAVNNSLINYPNQPKPAFYAVSDACRPFLASARMPKFTWQEGETFSCDLYILNDLYSDIPGGKVKVTLVAGGKELDLLTWEFEQAGPNRNITGPTVRGVLPRWDTGRFDVVLEVEDHPEYSSRYTLLYKPLTSKGNPRAARRLNQ